MSTDFSAQKGVAGIPLHFLVDTYEDLDPSAEPIHRSVCKIKVFRDKVRMCVCVGGGLEPRDFAVISCRPSIEAIVMHTFFY